MYAIQHIYKISTELITMFTKLHTAYNVINLLIVLIKKIVTYECISWNMSDA